jgi:anti-anti-sigma factor
MLGVEAEESGNIVVLNCIGHIVKGAEAASIRAAVFSKSDASMVVLDLSRVDVIDAYGLGALLELHEWAKANGKGFTLVNPTGLIQRVFAITHLDSVFDISFREEAPPAGADDEPPAKPVEDRPVSGVANCQPFKPRQSADIN